MRRAEARTPWRMQVEQRVGQIPADETARDARAQMSAIGMTGRLKELVAFSHNADAVADAKQTLDAVEGKIDF
jgi:hypothetical protein